jgi:hypothetical protein
MTDETDQRVIDQVEKLLRVASKAGTPEEAAAFSAKANALMAEYNLTMSTIEEKSSDGLKTKRLDEQVGGGLYKFERRLWRSIARLNFCMYFTLVVPTKEGSRKFKRGRKYTHEHRLVGRAVNVIATKNLADYLLGKIRDLCKERLTTVSGAGVTSGDQTVAWTSSWAIAFREGVADEIIEKIEERRSAQEKAEERKARQAAKAAERAGHSVSTALTLTDVKEREHVANYDFIHGEGAWARKQALAEEQRREEEEEERKQALAEAEAERVYVEWAAANPEEARKMEEEARKKERRHEAARDRRMANGGGWGRYSMRESARDRRRGSSAYYAGRDAGSGVSIDQQVSGGRKAITKR